MKHTMLTFFILFLAVPLIGQTIIIGDTTNTSYYEFNPEISMEIQTDGAEETYELDINFDGSADIHFKLAGSSSYGSIRMDLSHQNIASRKYDFFPCTDLLKLEEEVPLAFLNGADWHTYPDSSSNIMYVAFSPPDEICGSRPEDDLYIPFRYLSQGDTLYGWIEIEYQIQPLDHFLKIKRFAIQENLSTSATSILLNQTTVFPNPAMDVIIVETDENLSPSDNIDIEIFDSTGRYLNTQQLTSSQQRIDISDLSDGLYFLILNSPQGKVSHSFMKL